MANQIGGGNEREPVRVHVSHLELPLPERRVTLPELALNLSERLDPFDFAINQAFALELLGERVIVTETGHHSFFSQEERTFYLLGVTEPYVTPMTIDPQAGAAYLQWIGLRLGEVDFEGQRAFIGLHVAGYNRRLVDYDQVAAFAQDRERRKLAQSVPLLHGRLVYLSDESESGAATFSLDIPDHKETFLSRLGKEMLFSQQELTSLREDRARLQHLVDVTVHDKPAIAFWQRHGITDAEFNRMLQRGRPEIETVRWRLPESGDKAPYGVQLILAGGLGENLRANPRLLWGILRDLEASVASFYPSGHAQEAFRLYSYNFAVIMHEHEGKTEIIVCPSDSIRAGCLEKQNIIIHRPVRQTT